jgi:hypothetical protein
MTDHAAHEDEVQEEIREQAAAEPVDDETAREALELELMDEDASGEGEDIGEHID